MVDEYTNNEEINEDEIIEDSLGNEESTIESDDDFSTENSTNDVSNEGSGNIILQGTAGPILLQVGTDFLSHLKKNQDSEYKNLDEKEQKLYNRYIANIQNKIIDKNYKDAYKYCLRAEKLAPDEPLTWQFMALCEFLRNPVGTIHRQANNIRPHLEKAKTHGIKDEEYIELTKDIAFSLFNAVKRNCKAIKPHVDEDTGIKIWSTAQINESLQYLKAYETCFSLYEDPAFLEEAILEISTPYKYLAINEEVEIENLEQCGTFRADKRRNYLIELLQEFNPEYEPPELSEKQPNRFKILKEFPNSRFIIRNNE